MKKYSEQEAMSEVFNISPLAPRMRVYKIRYAEGKLSQKIINEILESHNFTVIQQTLYKKKK